MNSSHCFAYTHKQTNKQNGTSLFVHLSRPLFLTVVSTANPPESSRKTGTLRVDGFTGPFGKASFADERTTNGGCCEGATAAAVPTSASDQAAAPNGSYAPPVPPPRRLANRDDTAVRQGEVRREDKEHPDENGDLDGELGDKCGRRR